MGAAKADWPFVRALGTEGEKEQGWPRCASCGRRPAGWDQV